MSLWPGLGLGPTNGSECFAKIQDTVSLLQTYLVILCDIISANIRD